jgi:hypothetical protein
MQQSLLAMKVLRRLLVSGYEHPNRETEASTLWQLTQEHLGTFIQLSKQDHPRRDLLEKHMVQFAKLHHEMSRDHPAAFALLPNSLSLVRAYWDLTKSFGEVFGSKEAVVSAVANAQIGSQGDQSDSSSVEKLALEGLLILRACVKMVHNPAQTFKYRTPSDKEERNAATSLIQQELLTDDFVREVMEILVTRFFVFRASDLREWEEEPEEWEKREEGDGEDWEFSVRSCSEKLFLDVAINYKEMLVQPLLQVFYSVANVQNEDVLFKDSVYTAIGLAAPVVHEHLDFDAFIRDVLVLEVQKEKPGFSILRRRAAILLGQWISVKVSADSRPAVYQIFQHLLNTSDRLNDQVVRVTAGRQLKNICESWEFNTEQFLPYAETTLSETMSLIEEVELTETKMALLNTISVIVENLDKHIRPFADSIVGILPLLWQESAEEHMMKQAILTILTRLVTAMKADSTPLHPMVFPIIQGVLEPGSGIEVYLLEDALDLWSSVLQQTPTPASEQLLQLTEGLFPLFDSGGENLRRAVEITESYVLLAPEFKLSAGSSGRMFAALTPLLGTLRAEANGLVCNLVEVCIKMAERMGGEQAVESLAAELVRSGFLEKIIKGLKGSWTAHCTTGPNKIESLVDGVVETDYFAILARLVLGNLQSSCRAIESASQGEDLASTMKWLLEEWFSHFENVGDPSRRKLMCLALTKLLETNQSWILLSLQSLMTVWTDVITELREDERDTKGDSLVYNPQSANEYEGVEESPEDGRRKELMYQDIVHRTNLPEFVQACLRGAVEGAGGETRFMEEWVANVDQDVLDAFAKLGVMG